MTIKQLILLLQVEQGGFDFSHSKFHRDLTVLEKADLIYTDSDGEPKVRPRTQTKIAAILELF